MKFSDESLEKLRLVFPQNFHTRKLGENTVFYPQDYAVTIF